MSNFQNPNDFMKNTLKFPPPEHDGLVHKNNHSKNVTIIFNIFCENNLGIISVSNIYYKWQQKVAKKLHKFFVAKHVTTIRVEKVAMINIY
jgi:hypothetical protein